MSDLVGNPEDRLILYGHVFLVADGTGSVLPT